MSSAAKTFVLLVLLTAAGTEAQVAMAPGSVMSLGSPAVDQLAPNTLLLGSGTAMSYDSNALNSKPPTPNVQYTIFPQIGLNLARPRWDALISFVPGFSYSSANLPQYQAVSLTSAVSLKYRASQRLSLNFRNSLVSSTNPFDSLTLNYQSGSGGVSSIAATALNYLPRTNEIVSADAAYDLSARTSLIAETSYNYISYPHDPSIPSFAQPFQQSNSFQISMGLLYKSSPRYQSGMQYDAQLFHSGQGQIKTVGHSIQYALQYSPTPTLNISAMIGPEYAQSTYAGGLGIGGGASLVNQRAAGWSWTGNAAMNWTRGQNLLSVSASRQLSLGTQYQGNVETIALYADFRRQLAHRTDLTLFSGYNISKPVSLAQSVPRFSNNYLSTGAAITKTIDRCWVIGLAYWYLVQNSPQNIPQSVRALYSGDHNRLDISLSYSIGKPLRK